MFSLLAAFQFWSKRLAPFGRPELFGDEQALEEEVFRQVSIGMSVGQAKQILTHNGFACQLAPGENRLACTAWRKESLTTALVEQVDVRFDDAGSVVGVKVRSFVDGP